MSERILVIEDDAALRAGLVAGLGGEGFAVEAAADGREGRRLIQRGGFDLALLDLMLPCVSGVELCREVRERRLRLPIIVLTARGDELDRVLLLELGADDYVVKPYSLRELVARIRAVLRRTRTGAAPAGAAVPTTLRLGAAEVDFEAYVVRRGGEELPLAPKEAAMLRLLVERAGGVVSREEFLEWVWGHAGEFVTQRTVDNHVLRLRQKIEADPRQPRHLLTAHGIGYRLVTNP